jgi:hypothetical protein
MPRLLLALVLFPIDVAAAPVPKDKNPVVYFPTAEGTRWVTQLSFDGKVEATYSVSVINVEEKEGVRMVTLQYGIGREAKQTVHEVTAGGVAVRSAGGGKPIPRLKVGEKAGTTWEAEEQVSPKVARKVTFTAGDEEEVEVPAGKFKAVRVDSEFEEGGVKQRASTWFAPGVGQVKYALNANGTTLTEELKEFTPGKGAKK